MIREVVEIVAGRHNLADFPDWMITVLCYVDFNTQIGCARTNRAWHAHTTASDENSAFWINLNEQVCRTRTIYESPSTKSARMRFAYAYALKDMWGLGHAPNTAHNTDLSDQARAGESFKINVVARFCPDNKKRREAEALSDTGRKQYLPLHQRLQGIKRSSGVATTNEAARILMQQLSNPETNTSTSTTQILEINDRTRNVMTIAPGVGMRVFHFDDVFKGAGVTQAELYCSAGSPMVRDFMNGTDACCIVFGQTGSGKTYTMFGEGGVESSTAGIVPKAALEILTAMGDREANYDIDAELFLSYIEVFGDEVCDLLNDGELVAQNRSAAQRWVMDGHARHSVAGITDLEDLLAEGDKQKRRAATFMNERSSRAHTLFILTLKQKHRITGAENESMLVLADLGGSEDTKKSGAAHTLTAAGIKPADQKGESMEIDEGDGEDEAAAPAANWNAYYKNRQRMQEAIHINMGLLSLKNCVRALHARQKGEKVHIPYQDSKLTHLLAAVLGGKASTSIVVTGSPFASDAVETINTLRFGEDCRAIVTTGSKLDATARAMKQMVEVLDEEIAEAEKAYKTSEEWVKERVKKRRIEVEEPKHDASIIKDGFRYDEHGVAHAIHEEQEEEEVDVYRMKGGETEAAHLEELLARRRRLLGA